MPSEAADVEVACLRAIEDGSFRLDGEGAFCGSIAADVRPPGDRFPADLVPEDGSGFVERSSERPTVHPDPGVRLPFGVTHEDLPVLGGLGAPDDLDSRVAARTAPGRGVGELTDPPQSVLSIRGAFDDPCGGGGLAGVRRLDGTGDKPVDGRHGRRGQSEPAREVTGCNRPLGVGQREGEEPRDGGGVSCLAGQLAQAASALGEPA